MSKEDNFELMNRLLFEYYEFGIQIEHRDNGTKELNVNHLEPTSLQMYNTIITQVLW